MKTKEMIQAVVAVMVLVAAGYLIYSQLVPKKPKSASVATIHKITPIEPSFNEDGLRRIGDSSQVRNFYTAPDLQNGLGNTHPFTPVQ